MKKIEQKVIKFVDSNDLILPGNKLLVALSGGPDSVFILHFLYKYKKRIKIELAAMHINHQLRGQDSERDEIFCKQLCRKLNVQYHSESVDIKKYAKKNKLSLEEAARNVRYNILEKTCNEFGYDKIVTAHNSNDNAETVLLNLFSGTGFNGISGIPITRGNIIRPLLSLSKEEILLYLKSKDLKFRIDKSNMDVNFRRNLIRHKIIPLIKKEINPSFEDTMMKSTQVFKQGINILNVQVAKVLKKHVSSSGNYVEIDLEMLDLYPKEILGNVLRKILEVKFSHQFSFNDFSKIKGLISKQTGRREDLAGNLVVYRERNSLLIRKEKIDKYKPIELSIGESDNIGLLKIGITPVKKASSKFSSAQNVEFVSADKLDDTFTIRRWKPGDKFKPLGMKNYKKVSDFLNEQKIPASEKKNQLLLTNRNNIVWIVGLRIDDRFKIDKETKLIWKLWTM